MKSNAATTAPSTSSTKTAVYYRVSTALQTNDCQKPDVLAMLAARGLAVDLVFEEQASAAKRRPEFERMLAAARRREFDVLAIWAMDRFGRSMVGNVRDFMALDEAGVRVLSVREPWLDGSGPVRDLLISIFSWVAQQERASLIQRTRNGIANARVGGKPWGRRSPSLTFADKAKAIRLAREWDTGGRTGGYKGLAALLGRVSPTTARKLWLGLEPLPVDPLAPLSLDE